jgi:peptidoglycan/xylan/chitin deacetylase (PgdA/CDA1 family)
MTTKHRLKLALRNLYARILFHGGLHAVVDRLMPRRLVILAGHCVRPASGAWPAGEHLPADMAIADAKLERFVAWLGRRYQIVTVGEGVERLERGWRGRNLVALSFDDGYRDNHRVLLPLLRRAGAGATVYLESRPLDERKVNWSHKYFWCLARSSPFDFVHRYGAATSDQAVFHSLNQVVAEERVDARYHLKRILKYEAEPRERDRAIDAVFAGLGGDERELCERLYMSWDEARELQEAGVELGGHTAGHQILSRLEASEQRREISDGAASMRRELGREIPSFAYPWGRRWDFDAASKDAVRAEAFRSAVTMHAGVNVARTDRYELKRVAIDDSAELHLLVAEACGGFELLRKLGIDLAA